MIDIIDKFDGKYAFLSNFYPCDVFSAEDMLVYPSVEHAFQAAKVKDVETKRAFQVAPSPAAAKKLGKQVPLRDDWKNIKLDVMYNLVWSKFVNNSELRYKLLSTDDAELVEGNTWGDTFWGMCKSVGDNHLGKILMNVRDELDGKNHCK